jgi:hypothetical protein
MREIEKARETTRLRTRRGDWEREIEREREREIWEEWEHKEKIRRERNRRTRGNMMGENNKIERIDQKIKENF